MSLSPSHFKMLRASDLNDESIDTMGCYSVPPAEINRLSPSLQSCESLLAFPYPTVDGFCRYRLFPPQGSMKYWQPAGSGTHLYIMPSVRSIMSNPSVELAITEGEKKSACLTQHGIPTIGISGVWSWGNGTGDLHAEFDPVAFVDRAVLIVFDTNAWRQEKIDIGRALYALGKAIEKRGGKVEAVVIPPAGDGSDQGADDFIAANGIGKFKELKRIRLRHDSLAQFKPWWEQWLEKKSAESKELSKIAAKIAEVEPWHEPVDGLALVNEIRATFKRFVVTVQAESIVVESLWVLFAHALDAFGIAPMLAFWSPLPQCGKSTNQTVAARLVPKPLEASHFTPASVCRTIEKYRPVVMIDEFAHVKDTNPDLLAVLRASHMRSTAFIVRTVGDSHEPEIFSTWAAKSFAVTTTKIEPALASRCLIVNMQKRTKREKVEIYRPVRNEYPELDILRRKAARWALDNLAAVRDAEPQFPDIENRDLDNYEPLFQIAHVIGGEWPSLITKAALKLLGNTRGLEQELSLELLKDIKAVFDAEPVSEDRKLASADMVAALAETEDRPWREYNRGKPITQNQVARLLKDFFIYSRKIRPEGAAKPLQGYFEHQFKDAFERYLLPDSPETQSTPLNTDFQPEQKNSDNENNNLSQKTQPEQKNSVPVAESDLSAEKDRQSSCVPVQN